MSGNAWSSQPAAPPSEGLPNEARGRLNLTRKLMPSPPGASHVVLTGHACHVPQEAGNQVASGQPGSTSPTHDLAPSHALAA